MSPIANYLNLFKSSGTVFLGKNKQKKTLSCKSQMQETKFKNILTFQSCCRRLCFQHRFRFFLLSHSTLSLTCIAVQRQTCEGCSRNVWAAGAGDAWACQSFNWYLPIAGFPRLGFQSWRKVWLTNCEVETQLTEVAGEGLWL